jgi:hypothetical protein
LETANSSGPNHYFLDTPGWVVKMNAPAFHDLNAGAFFSRATQYALHL